MGMINAVLFDMDGVIFDSREAALTRFKSVLKEFGFEFPKGRADFVNRGGTDPEIIKGLLPDVEQQKLALMSKRASELTAPLQHLKLNPGAKEAIIELSKTKKLAIVSNDNRPNIERKLEKFGLKCCFPVVVSADDVKKAKPDAEPIEKALKLLGAKKEEAIYIGDNEVDRLAGKAAKIKTIVRSNFHEGRNFFRKELFDIIRAG
jgi:pyrophosphatase PpaX